MAMETSTMPWVLARVASGTASVIITVPETRPRFQPSPSRVSASASRATESAGAAAALIPAARRVRPEAGLSAYGRTRRRASRSAGRAIQTSIHVPPSRTDIHLVREGWGEAVFPMVPGHEIAGVVSEASPGVTKYKVGDRVGVDCIVDSCRECGNCKAGQEQHCVQGAVQTYAAIGRDGEPTYGGYATHVVVDENFVVRIPDGLSLDVAASLLCAGITTYAPLKQWGAGPGKKVAVVGLGGLGHVGVKIAHTLAPRSRSSPSPGARRTTA
jgi:hypothetical protein